MTFWLIYLAGAVSVPASVVFSELALVAMDRLSGGRGVYPRTTIRIVGSMAVSWMCWTGLIAVWWFL